MASSPTGPDQQLLISSFLEIAVGQSADTAAQFLHATAWNLDEAVQLFFVGADAAPAPGAGASERAAEEVGEDGVRAPLPAVKDTLYGGPEFSCSLLVAVISKCGALRCKQRVFGCCRLPSHSVVALRNPEERRLPAVWESDQTSASTLNGSSDNLASLYRPPYSLMYNGPFEKAKVEASFEDKWLLVNLQSTEEFSSHMLNRDTWSNEAVAQTIRTNFIFWQVYHDSSEGKKVCTYYNLDSIPAILVIDPITGQKIRAWHGMVHPERLLEELLQYMDNGPKNQHVSLPHKRSRESVDNSALKIPEKVTEDEDEEVRRALAASLEGLEGPRSPPPTDVEQPAPEKDVESDTNGKPSYPPLPEEPTGDRGLLCRVGIRLPDGRRVQRNFLRTDPIKFLWSFCSPLVEEGVTRPFHFRQAITDFSKNLDFDSDLTFDEAGLSNAMIFLTWD